MYHPLLYKYWVWGGSVEGGVRCDVIVPAVPGMNGPGIRGIGLLMLPYFEEEFHGIHLGLPRDNSFQSFVRNSFHGFTS